MSIWNKGGLEIWRLYIFANYYSQEKDFSLKEYGQFGDIG